ncbi:dolichyl-phosphate mannosyltransferase subunit 3 [Leptinotarsa decemlineata]|uniref:dolichyl-phosphate mannosyltransferase subunit 3 n=1 Tax=Leptinotarsa decemlineata TaxID=7539 RepID=UPI000C254E21|nr:dolichol-phosphate mannosyltransferase subunit 3 [Leptinotarsa decemlineata]
MTKLVEWLSGFSILIAIWLYMIKEERHFNFVHEHYDIVLYSPVIFVILFGLYAASVVLYRVYAFNDCQAAAIELQNEVQEARENLTELGFKFKEKTN